MPKDPSKYRYFTVGIAWESWTLARLEADAQLHQMEDQPAKLITLRLTEYYKLVERGMIPGMTSMIPSPVAANGHNGMTALVERDDTSSSDNDTTSAEQTDQAADEAADYWGTL